MLREKYPARVGVLAGLGLIVSSFSAVDRASSPINSPLCAEVRGDLSVILGAHRSGDSMHPLNQPDDVSSCNPLWEGQENIEQTKPTAEDILKLMATSDTVFIGNSISQGMRSALINQFEGNDEDTVSLPCFIGGWGWETDRIAKRVKRASSKTKLKEAQLVIIGGGGGNDYPLSYQETLDELEKIVHVSLEQSNGLVVITTGLPAGKDWVSESGKKRRDAIREGIFQKWRDHPNSRIIVVDLFGPFATVDGYLKSKPPGGEGNRRHPEWAYPEALDIIANVIATHWKNECEERRLICAEA